MPTNKKYFELIILGCSGGPLSGKTCSFLLKPTDVAYVDYIETNNGPKNYPLLAIDAGTGLTSIFDILDNEEKNKLDYLKSSFLVELYPKTFDNMDKLVNCMSKFICTDNMDIKIPFSNIKQSLLDNCVDLDESTGSLTNFQIAHRILNSINGYFITHSHLDHVSSLVINSPAFKKPKKVFGISETMTSIRNNLFNDSVWPDLVSLGLISLNILEENVIHNDLSDRYALSLFKVSHGMHLINNDRYFSTAFLIKDKLHDYNVLFFGDVESDLSSNTNYNSIIWNNVSPLINEDKLNTCIIECSTTDMPPPLFGHLTPSNLIYEMLNLRKICIDLKNKHPGKQIDQTLPYDDDYYKSSIFQPLKDLNVIIIHVKETLEDINPRQLILSKLNELNTVHNLGINFSIALSGISLIV